MGQILAHRTWPSGDRIRTRLWWTYLSPRAPSSPLGEGRGEAVPAIQEEKVYLMDEEENVREEDDSKFYKWFGVVFWVVLSLCVLAIVVAGTAAIIDRIL